MQKFTTLLFSLLITTVFFSSCKKNDIDGPAAEIDCFTVKDWADNLGTRFLLNEYGFNGDKLDKITNFKPNGKKTESRIEYDYKGRVINIFEKVSAEGTIPEANYLTTFEYSANGRMVRTDNYKVIDGNNRTVQVRLYNYRGDKVEKLISSAGVHWRYEYNDSGNVIKTFYKPADTNEFLQEEFTSYDDKLLDKTVQKAHILLNMSTSASGINLSKNNVLAYKVYHPDGSIKASYNFTREYNPGGNQTKVVTTTTTSSTTTTSVETVYPNCK